MPTIWRLLVNLMIALLLEFALHRHGPHSFFRVLFIFLFITAGQNLYLWVARRKSP